ncbi:MAG: hypothetical protein K0S27_84 [Gammaproteobacteria bacterium]|jgi:hypothetical protein|nr:hypothetical protein [Gammaproteobacteria bacterium]
MAHPPACKRVSFIKMLQLLAAASYKYKLKNTILEGGAKMTYCFDLIGYFFIPHPNLMFHRFDIL